LPVPTDAQGQPVIHYTTVYNVFAQWADEGALWQAFIASVRRPGSRAAPRPPRAPWRRDDHHGPKRGDGRGSSGYQHQKGEQVIALIDHTGSVSAPLPVAPVHATDLVRLPKGLQALKQVAQQGGWDLGGASLNLDGGLASTHNRQGIFHAGLIPNIAEKPHDRKHPKGGRNRLFNAAIHA
jgi:hypothetical protein